MVLEAPTFEGDRDFWAEDLTGTGLLSSFTIGFFDATDTPFVDSYEFCCVGDRERREQRRIPIRGHFRLEADLKR